MRTLHLGVIVACLLAIPSDLPPASRPQAGVTVWLQTTGPAAAWLELGDNRVGPLPVDGRHPFGWTGTDGRIVVAAAGSCSITIDGRQVATDTGSDARCVYP